MATYVLVFSSGTRWLQLETDFKVCDFASEKLRIFLVMVWNQRIKLSFALRYFLTFSTQWSPVVQFSSGFDLHSSLHSREITFCLLPLSVSLSCIFNILNYFCFSCFQYFIVCQNMTPSSPRTTIRIFAEIYWNCATCLMISPRKCSVDLLYLINTSSILD